ncbi:MAG TPA: UvrD-helicase domain-containing protein, partial [Isosphaeraceae bacterium]|nr:UvrD-helicase domain-containing protein [Isosphaeraceae bacterium]
MRKIRLKSPLNDRLSDQFQRELNDSQRAAAMAPDGYNLILAGPGSGKTRVITYRVAYLIATGVPAGSIMLVTFTRRAAREMVRRMELLIGQQAAKVWAGTFHHIGNRLLRRAAALLGYQPNFT